MLDARATGCLVIGPDTAPVREVIRDGRTGVLTDFFDPAALAARVADALAHLKRYPPLLAAALVTMRERYGLEAGLRGYLALMGLR